MSLFPSSAELKLRACLTFLVGTAFTICMPLAFAAQESLETQLDHFHTERLEDLANIDLRTDVRIFTVMAALNAAGFNYETPGEEMSAVRIGVRRDLADLDPELLFQLESIYRSRSSSSPTTIQSDFTSFALLLSGPPSFNLQMTADEMPGNTRQLLGFETLVRDFYKKANVESLWQRYQPIYTQRLNAYRPVLKEMIRETLEYFRIPARIVLDRRIILTLDLLNFKGIANARNLEKIYYIAVGPTDDPRSNYRQLQHEYLHFLIDPLVEKYSGILSKHRDLVSLANEQPALKSEFQGRYHVIVAESLIEAIVSRMESPQREDRFLVESFRKGLVLTPYFYESLARFENESDATLPEALEEVFKRTSKSRVDEDGERIARLEITIQAEDQARLKSEQERSQAHEASRRRRELLKEAGQLLMEENFPDARQKLELLLKEDPDNGNAHFYLGQIAGKMGQHEQAFRYYLEAAQSPDTAEWIKAWSLLRAGKFLASQKKFQEARQHFDQVLSLQGDLRGATEEARLSLSRLP